MNPRWSIVAALCALAAGHAADAQTLPGAQTYQDNCQSCHGTTLAGGRGPSLFSASILSSHSDDSLKQIVKAGVANSEMPSFAGRLSDDEIGQVVAYLHIRGGQLAANPPFTPSPDGQVIHSQKQNFKIEIIASGLETPWGESFLP